MNHHRHSRSALVGSRGGCRHCRRRTARARGMAARGDKRRAFLNAAAWPRRHYLATRDNIYHQACGDNGCQWHYLPRCCRRLPLVAHRGASLPCAGLPRGACAAIKHIASAPRIYICARLIALCCNAAAIYKRGCGDAAQRTLAATTRISGA